MGDLSIKKDARYAESNIAVIGLTHNAYGRPQFILINSDEGRNPGLKFCGSRFRAPLTREQTLEDVARARFEEQTGLVMDKMLGLRAVMPSRSRHRDQQWLFRNVLLGVVSDVSNRKTYDGREVYVADPGQGCYEKEEFVKKLGDSKSRVPLKWVNDDNLVLARLARNILYNFDWQRISTNWYQRVPCVGVEPQTQTKGRPLGCGLAIASMILLYQPNPKETRKVILLKRKGDEFPGYAGGKIETLDSPDSENLDPISCCAKEGSEEFGFQIQPRALVSVGVTGLHMMGTEFEWYNSLIDYLFVAEPTNPHAVARALKNPSDFLEGKMDSYVVESVDEHRDRVMKGELRMPDMAPGGNQFYRSSPGENIPLTQIVSSGFV